MIFQPIQTIPNIFITHYENKKSVPKYNELTKDILFNKNEKYIIYRLYESWPTRILNGILYRNYILMGYDPNLTDHDKKRWKKYQHKIIYGFTEIDFDNFKKELPLNWIQDENQDINQSLKSGHIYGWIPVYEINEEQSPDIQRTNKYYIKGFEWLLEKYIHIPQLNKKSDLYNINFLDGYYNLVGKYIPGDNGKPRENFQTFALLPYNYEELICPLNYDELREWMKKNPRVFGLLITNESQTKFVKTTRYDMLFANELLNRYDLYYARKQFNIDGLI